MWFQGKRKWLAACRLLIFGALLSGFLSACSTGRPLATSLKVPTPKIQPTAFLPETPTVPVVLDPACLIGQWIVVGMQESVAESYERTQSPLQLQGIEGETRYDFRTDGSLEISFDQLILSLSGQIDGQDILARNLMSGTAEAQYRLNVPDREITFSDFGGEGIQVATEINGQVLAQGDFPAWRAFSSNLASGNDAIPTTGPTRVIKESVAAITCSGNEMHLQTVNPNPGPPVNLQRDPG